MGAGARTQAPSRHDRGAHSRLVTFRVDLNSYGVKEAKWRDTCVNQPHFVISESPRYVGRAVAHLAGDPDVAHWSVQSLSSGQLAKLYGFSDLDGSQPDCRRYFPEVHDAGKPDDATGYREHL